jgi:hypothetical protein
MAFGLGVLDGLAEAGLPVHEAPLLGTSGGAWAAGTYALGLPLADVVHASATGKRAGVPQNELTRSVFGDSRDPRVRATAIERRTGRIRILKGSEVGVADAIGASSSLPGLFPAYDVNGKRYVDGGLRSPTAAQLSPSASLLVVAAPMAGAGFGPMGRVLSTTLETELFRWRRRTGGATLVLSPDREFSAAVGSGLRCLLNAATTPVVYDAARRLAVSKGLRHLDGMPTAA